MNTTQAHGRNRHRWKPDLVAINDIAAQCSPCDSSHPFLIQHGITSVSGHIFDGTHLAGIPCKGAYVAFVHDKGHKAVNAVFKVQNDQGAFTDLFVPGAPIAECWTRIGENTPTKVVAVDLASGLAIHQATGDAVAVVHYHDNLLSVCKSLRAAFPQGNIVIAAEAGTTEEFPAVKKNIIAAASAINASVALPGSELSFATLNVEQGAGKVKSCVDAARPLRADVVVQAEGSKAATQHAWPRSVHPGFLLAAICAYLARYTVLPFSAIYAMTLWILATHLTPIFNVAPVLALLSLTRRCGKSVTLLAMTALINRPKVTSETTSAAVYEMCDEGYVPVMDEGDQYFKKQANPLNAIVNSGYTRIASVVTRKGKEYKTFCFKLIAGIGTLPATIMDRSIVIPMYRKSRQEKVERYKATDNDETTVLRAMIARFVSDQAKNIAETEAEVPLLDNDRALDNWEPLFAIASCAGPDWIKNTHLAALELTPSDDEIPMILEEFICDVVTIFLRSGDEFISTADLITALCKDEDKPWATFSRNQQTISIHDLGKLMREAKVKVGEQKHDAKGNRRGYYRRDVEHLFDGYGPSAPSA